jgi:hypothetical protein
MKREDAKNLVLWFGNQLLGREWGIPSRSRRSNFPFLGMKTEEANNLVDWFGNQLFERVGGFLLAAFYIPRDEKRGCKKSGLLVWKPLLERVGDSFSQNALKLSVPHEKRGCKNLVFLVLFGNELLEGVVDSFSHQTLKHSIPGDEKRGCKKSGFMVWKSTLRERVGNSSRSRRSNFPFLGMKKENAKISFFFFFF